MAARSTAGRMKSRRQARCEWGCRQTRQSSAALFAAVAPLRRRFQLSRDAAAVDVRRDVLRSPAGTRLASCRKLSLLSENLVGSTTGNIPSPDRSETTGVHSVLLLCRIV